MNFLFLLFVSFVVSLPIQNKNNYQSISICEKGKSCDGKQYVLPEAIIYVNNNNNTICDCKEMIFDSADSVFIIKSKDIDVQSIKSANYIKMMYAIDISHSLYLVAIPTEKEMEFEISFKIDRQKINFQSKFAGISTQRKPNTLNLANRQKLEMAEKDDIINSMQVAEYTDIIRKLSGDTSFTVPSGTYQIRTRHSSTTENVRAAEFIYEYLDNLGYETYYESFRCQSGYNTQNIIGVKRGSTLPNEVIVVGGHMDSTSGTTSNAPGAIDNASGADGMMLIARAFANVTLARTVFFMGFGCEEQGLIGSEYFIENTDENVVSALTMDMIAYSNDYYGVMIEGTTNPDVQTLMRLMEENCETYSPRLSTTTRNFSFGSDHVSFQNAGVPAFLAIEQDETDYNCYHSTCDSFSNVESNMGTDITKAMAGVLYDVAKTV